jgi:PPOX class probable F420-dependent enzyme
MQIPQSVRELIAKAPLAHLTTLNSDGSPQVTVIWVGIENEEFVMAHLAVHKKIKNIRRDGRVALSMLSDKTSANGLREYLVVHGNARVTEGGAVDLPGASRATVSRAGSCLPAARHAQHCGLRHPNHAEAFHGYRAVGCASCRVRRHEMRPLT